MAKENKNIFFSVQQQTLGAKTVIHQRSTVPCGEDKYSASSVHRCKFNYSTKTLVQPYSRVIAVHVFHLLFFGQLKAKNGDEENCKKNTH